MPTSGQKESADAVACGWVDSAELVHACECRERRTRIESRTNIMLDVDADLQHRHTRVAFDVHDFVGAITVSHDLVELALFEIEDEDRAIIGVDDGLSDDPVDPPFNERKRLENDFIQTHRTLENDWHVCLRENTNKKTPSGVICLRCVMYAN